MLKILVADMGMVTGRLYWLSFLGQAVLTRIAHNVMKILKINYHKVDTESYVCKDIRMS